MTHEIKIAMAQLNPHVGDVGGNADLLRETRAQAADADILVCGELFLSGYPPEDLVLKNAFIRHIRDTATALAAETAAGGPSLVFGLPWVEGDKLYNSVMIAEKGKYALRHKVHLPNYSVFDEKRLFTPGPMPMPGSVCGLSIGFPICEDIWFDDVVRHLKDKGAKLLISPNGSPFETGKHPNRLVHAQNCCAETGLPMLYVNQIGGQDELVFDGSSFAMQSNGQVQVQMPAWQTGVTMTQWHETPRGVKCETDSICEIEDGHAAMYQAAVLGLRDYVAKNKFPGVLLGLSGGIDSAICAAMAVDALGAARVRCVMLPSRYTSQASLDDAADCAERLGVQLDTVGISDTVAALETGLAPLFEDLPADITEENIQSRTRGTLLMALSNKFGLMVVTTGNKSEVSVGYATLYGDMNGGYNPIKDIYKTDVFALSRWRNENLPHGALGPSGEIIPPAIIDKPPTAELREDQKDEDSLPPYDVLDDILVCLVEEELSFDNIVARGHDPKRSGGLSICCIFRNINGDRPRRVLKSAAAISVVTAVIRLPTASATPV